MSPRDTILRRIREALSVAAPHPHHAAVTSPEHPTPQDWLPAVGTSFDDQLALFRSNSEALKATFDVVHSLEEATEKIRSLAASGNWQSVGIHRTPLTEHLLPILRGVVFTDDGYETPALEACDAGITTCECLVAQTGSVLVTTHNGGRALSVLPPHHIVIALASQLLPDLTAALSFVQKKYTGSLPSALSFITGPSRTGDIERILVLGAHGPKKLTIFLIDDR